MEIFHPTGEAFKGLKRKEAEGLDNYDSGTRRRTIEQGFSTGILTPEERQTLFEAALHDQAIFNDVASELRVGCVSAVAGDPGAACQSDRG